MTEQTTERTAPRKRMLSGIKPSGDLTLGSYLGAIRNWRDRAEEFDCYYFMADLHAITVRQNPADLRRRTMEQLAQYLMHIKKGGSPFIAQEKEEETDVPEEA